MLIKLVNGADIRGLHEDMRPGMRVAGKIYEEYGQPLTITCGLNGEHSPGSWHYCGRAIDTRTRFWDEWVVEEVFEKLKEALPTGYRIFNEGDHFHIDYPAKQSGA